MNPFFKDFVPILKMALPEAFHYTWEFVSSWIIMSLSDTHGHLWLKKYMLKKRKRKKGQHKKLFCSYIWANQGCDKGNGVEVYMYYGTFHQEVNLPSCVAVVTRERNRPWGPILSKHAEKARGHEVKAGGGYFGYRQCAHRDDDASTTELALRTVRWKFVYIWSVLLVMHSAVLMIVFHSWWLDR